MNKIPYMNKHFLHEWISYMNKISDMNKIAFMNKNFLHEWKFLIRIKVSYINEFLIWIKFLIWIRISYMNEFLIWIKFLILMNFLMNRNYFYE